MKNTLFPGLPDYKGPKRGVFGLVHHSILCEISQDIRERIDFISCHKPKNERETRLRCLVHLPFNRLPKSFARAAKAYLKHDRFYWGPFRLFLSSFSKYWGSQDFFLKMPIEHKYKIEALIKELVPDCPWDGCKIVFPKK